MAVAFVPAVAGLTTAAGPAATTDAYRTGMLVVAGLAVLAAAVSAVGLRSRDQRRSVRDVICPVDGSPLQPDPGRCPRPSVQPAGGSSSTTTG